MAKQFTGIFPPIPTPFVRDGSLDEAGLRNNISRWNGTDLTGYVVLGSNGENVFLTDEEKLAAVRIVIEHAGPDKKVIVGTGCESTRATVELTKKAADLGADAALVVNPHYYPLAEEALLAHFQRVADRSTIPVFLYNVPKFTGANMNAALVIELAKHPNIVGIKDSSANVPQLTEILMGVDEDFTVLSGTASILYTAMCLGGSGGIIALANVAPDQAVGIYEAAVAGDHEEARELQLRMYPVNAAITSRFGVPGLKHAMDVLGYVGGLPRSPLRPPPERVQKEVVAILANAGLI
jgi:4-hydroxy-2-oxoglutarate aldolase